MSRNAAARTALVDDPGQADAASTSASYSAQAVAPAPAVAHRELDLELIQTVPFRVSSEVLLSDPLRPAETPTEEFRTLRTRLEQLQTTRAIQTVLITSPSPGEGKSFTAANLALAEAQLADNPTLLCDFDLREPILHRAFQIDRAPGISDYLLGQADLHETLKRIENSNLFVLPAGRVVANPLELLHLIEARQLMDCLRRDFRWIVLDSPPLLAVSDANVLGSLSDGTLLVTRIGTTSTDAMSRAITSLGQASILGIVANATRPSRS